jgi:hypothetical protein
LSFAAENRVTDHQKERRQILGSGFRSEGDPQGVKGWEQAMSQGEDEEEVEEQMLSTETIQQINIYVVQVTNLSTQTAVQVSQSYLSVQQIPPAP